MLVHLGDVALKGDDLKVVLCNDCVEEVDLLLHALLPQVEVGHDQTEVGVGPLEVEDLGVHVGDLLLHLSDLLLPGSDVPLQLFDLVVEDELELLQLLGLLLELEDPPGLILDGLLSLLDFLLVAILLLLLLLVVVLDVLDGLQDLFELGP